MPSSPNKKILCQGKYLRMIQADHWEYVERPDIPGAVVVLAVTDDGELLLVEQMRIPLSCHVIELPAGLAGDVAGERDFAETARRELLEETGYQADEMVLLATGPTTAGLTNEQVTLYHARRLRRIHDGGGDAAEQIVVHRVPLSDVPRWLDQQRQSGKLIDVKIYAGLYFLGQTFPPRA
jgi:ADP-ribose pyrophosphatase